VHGRHSTPAEVILRLVILRLVILRLFVVQHLYAWSYQETVTRVADSLVLRWFCRVSFRRVPTKTTLLRWAATIRPETLQALTDRAARLAQQAKVTRARKLRIDSTCVQTPIHHPTDSSLLGDGVRVLTRLIQRAKPLVQGTVAGGNVVVSTAFRSRLRTVRRLLRQIHRVSRHRGEEAAEQQRGLYARLLETTRQTVRQAQRIQEALAAAPAPATAPTPSVPRAAHRLQTHLQRFLPLVQRVMAQARARVLARQPVASTAKVLSLFEPQTRVVLRAKAGAPVEFGRQVVVDEVEGGLVTRFQVLADDESECHQALPAVEHHRAVFGHPPWLVTGDRRLHTQGVEAAAQGLGVTHVVIPWTGTPSAAQRACEQQRSWRRRYRWRAGIEGRIHSLRRDYGLLRSRSHGLLGLERDVGWGVLASNLCHIAAAQARRPCAATP
jgi:transposase, IS5 family